MLHLWGRARHAAASHRASVGDFYHYKLKGADAQIEPLRARGAEAPAGLKPSAGMTKPGTQRVPGRLPISLFACRQQAAQVAFVTVAEAFRPTVGGACAVCGWPKQR